MLRITDVSLFTFHYFSSVWGEHSNVVVPFCFYLPNLAHSLIIDSSKRWYASGQDAVNY